MRAMLTACTLIISLALVGCKTENSEPEKKETHTASGNFQSIHGESGEVAFGVSFMVPPQVKLSTDGAQPAVNAKEKTIIVETTSTGFKWKNAGGPETFAGSPTVFMYDGKISWEASGKIKKE